MMKNLLLVLLLAIPARAEIIEVSPAVKSESGPVTTIFRPEPVSRKLPDLAEQSSVTLRLEVLDTIAVGKPFRIFLRAYDPLGLPVPSFNLPVTFESIHGVVPVVSRARWLNGLLADTLIILKPGKNVRLSAIAGGSLATQHVDIEPPPLDREKWIELGDRYLSEGKFLDGINALQKASEMILPGDPAIERRIAKLYLEKGMWPEAQEHFLRAIRAAAQ